MVHKHASCTKIMQSMLELLRLIHLDRDVYFPAKLFTGDDLMPVDSAPSRNITHGARVGADYLEDLAIRKRFYAVLNPDDGQGA